MNLSVPICISDLLYEREIVILPGLGAFESNYKGANIDYVQGMVSPPSKEIRFNTNLVLDDGVLIDFMSKKHGVSEEEGRKAVEEYVADVKSRLQKKEIVAVPDLGRLYMDYEKKLRFLPENTNYNKDSFGLPAVNFYPVMRSREEAPAQSAEAQPLIPAPAPKKAAPMDWQNVSKFLFPTLIGLSLLVVGGSLYFMFSKYYDEKEEIKRKEQMAEAADRLNVKPETDSLNETGLPGAAVPDSTQKAENQSTEKEKPSPTPQKKSETAAQKEDSEAPTLLPGAEEGTIIIGGFKNRDNAQKLIQKLSRKGYEPFSDKKGDLNRVGVSFAYKTEGDIREVLQKVRAEFNASAWVLQPADFDDR